MKHSHQTHGRLHHSYCFFFLLTGNFAILKFFLDEKRYSVDLQDADGNTLLHILCRGKLNSKKQEAMQLVLEAGGNPLISNKQKQKPMDLLTALVR